MTDLLDRLRLVPRTVTTAGKNGVHCLVGEWCFEAAERVAELELQLVDEIRVKNDCSDRLQAMAESRDTQAQQLTECVARVRSAEFRVVELERQLAAEKAHLELRERCSAWYEARVATLEYALRLIEAEEYEPIVNELGESWTAAAAEIARAALAPPVAPDAASLYGHDGKTPFEVINADDELNAAP